MTVGAVAKYECLAKDKFDEAITHDLSNQITDAKAQSGLGIARNIARAEAISRPGNSGDNSQGIRIDRKGGAVEVDRIAEQLGFRIGTKSHRAVALYLRPQGATTAEVAAINGGPYLNCLKRVEATGHVIEKRKVLVPGSRPVTAYHIKLRD